LDTLILDIYPNGSSTYELYEDDGLTRDHRKGIFARTGITATQKPEATIVNINAAKGIYKGMLAKRWYRLFIHDDKKPTSIKINGHEIINIPAAWNYDGTDRNGILSINCGKWDVKQNVQIEIK
jgi:alpha-glucosidase